MEIQQNTRTVSLALGALGVVYGDLGTSPLYAVQQVLLHEAITEQSVFGVLSLVFWSLILVISTCYISVFLRANNDGEGGVLALLALLKRKLPNLPKSVLYMGMIGSGLLLGDGMITPAISVISAVEGLDMLSPHFSQAIVPISFTILFLLFTCQRYGIGRIGQFFGPVILLWFVTIAVLGIYNICQYPAILKAINPYYAWMFFQKSGWHAYAALSGIFLVITGAEAMYADLGHFGSRAIRLGWFVVALPALLLNYFGQGACALMQPDALANLFYATAPHWFVLPLLIIATLATIIASQAVIAASFSLVRQAILLELFPRLKILHTSAEEKGQVYVPAINYMLAIGTLLMVVVFKSSAALTAAFGMAINLVMLIVSILILYVAKHVWSWAASKVLAIFGPLIIVDCLFLGANLSKIHEGAWIPLVFGLLAFLLMTTWQGGMEVIRQYYFDKKPMSVTIQQLHRLNLQHVDDLIMIFVSDPYDKSGGGFYNYIKLNHILPRITLVVSVVIENFPFVKERDSIKLNTIGEGFFKVIIYYGFKQLIDIPHSLSLGQKRNVFPFNMEMTHLTYVVQNINISNAKFKFPLLYQWQKSVFRFFLRNSTVDSEFFRLPKSQTFSIGGFI